MRESETGKRFENRYVSAQAKISSIHADGLLLTHQHDIRWCCGFTGSNGILLVLVDRCIFITDGRYSIQADEEVIGAEVVIADFDLSTELVRFPVERLIIQADHVTAAYVERLVELLPKTELLFETGLLGLERASKESFEIQCIGEALHISETAIASIPGFVERGISERQLAAEIDYRQRRAGADGIAFDTIVAFGDHSALPHARPSPRCLEPNEPILIDTGCIVNGYASDITRNIFFGEPTSSYMALFDVVEKAVQAALVTARSGITAGELDHTARKVISDAGYGQYFMHSLGHGVGLDVHEWPRVSAKSEEVLTDNAVITIEPGIYLANEFGIRIEDLVVLGHEGCQRLNGLSRDLMIMGV